jgi:hypothetical protein
MQPLCECPVKAGSLTFPIDHRLADIAGDAARISYHQLSRWNFRFGGQKAKGSNHTLLTDFDVVHQHCVHPDQSVPANLGCMNHGAMPNMGTGL